MLWTDVTYTIDATRGLVYLSGRARPEIVLRIRKAKKHAKLIHMDYGHVIPPPYNPPNPYEAVPITYNYQNTWPPSPYQSPMYQPTAPPSPMTQYMYYRQDPNIQQPHPMAFPYNYYPYYVPEVLQYPPPYIPTREGVTGEQQCRILWRGCRISAEALIWYFFYIYQIMHKQMVLIFITFLVFFCHISHTVITRGWY